MSIVNHELLVVALRYITHDPTPTPPQYNGHNETSTPLERYIICARPLTTWATHRQSVTLLTVCLRLKLSHLKTAHTLFAYKQLAHRVLI